MLKFGVIGYGYWGPNIVRNLRSLEGCQVVGICDQTPAARKRIQAAHPGVPGQDVWPAAVGHRPD